jgi:hypothetical protein
MTFCLPFLTLHENRTLTKRMGTRTEVATLPCDGWVNKNWSVMTIHIKLQELWKYGSKSYAFDHNAIRMAVSLARTENDDTKLMELLKPRLRNNASNGEALHTPCTSNTPAVTIRFADGAKLPLGMCESCRKDELLARQRFNTHQHRKTMRTTQSVEATHVENAMALGAGRDTTPTAEIAKAQGSFANALMLGAKKDAEPARSLLDTKCVRNKSVLTKRVMSYDVTSLTADQFSVWKELDELSDENLTSFGTEYDNMLKMVDDNTMNVSFSALCRQVDSAIEQQAMSAVPDLISALPDVTDTRELENGYGMLLKHKTFEAISDCDDSYGGTVSPDNFFASQESGDGYKLTSELSSPGDTVQAQDVAETVAVQALVDMKHTPLRARKGKTASNVFTGSVMNTKKLAGMFDANTCESFGHIVWCHRSICSSRLASGKIGDVFKTTSIRKTSLFKPIRKALMPSVHQLMQACKGTMV